VSYELSIDIGGTFTDLFVRHGENETDSFKVPTTPEDPTVGFVNACEKAAQKYGIDLEELFDETSAIIHGTTISTNAIIEGTGSETALVTTEGFPEILLFREGGKDDPFDWDVDYPDPYVPLSHTYEVEERINAEGEVVIPLNEEAVRERIEAIEESDAEAVAVSLLWSHANPEHEGRIGELFEELAPDLPVSLSHEVNPIIREYRRTSSTVINASIYGLVQEYFSNLGTKLAERGYEDEPLIISANAGVMPIDEVARTPIWTVDSGPTMLPVAAHTFTRSELDEENVIVLDMGGTSLDMGVIRDGYVPRTREAEVGDGHILGIEKVDVKSIGSGGGSIAHVDEGGLLHVGPESAGSDPGPVCYMRGGEEPTFTDAAIALGYLNEDYFLGGEMDVSKRAAEEAIQERVGEPLGVGTTEAAYSIYAAAIQNMVNGIKDVTIERGIDPRKYVLSGGGGALGIPAVEIARELQIDDILLPRDAGVVCATGGLISDIRRDFSASHFTDTDDFDLAGVNRELESLGSRAEEFFERTGIDPDDRSVGVYAEGRYPGQIWELQVDVPTPPLDEADLETLVERFHDVHEDTFNYRQEDQSVEFLYWRVEATGETGTRIHSSATGAEHVSDARYDTRDAFFDGETRTAQAYRADRLAPEHSVDGPAFVDANNTTIVLPPDSQLTITEMGNYHVRT